MDDLDRYLAPARRDAAGRFLNCDHPLPQSSARVALPFFLRRAATSIVGRSGGAGAVSSGDLPARYGAAADPLIATWIGHATFLVRVDGVHFVTDPVWASTAGPAPGLGSRRLVEPAAPVDALPRVDAVVVSHNHYDHLDVAAVRALARRRPDIRFLVPLGNGALLRRAGAERVEELDWGQAVEVGGVRVHCLPAQHWSRRSLLDNRRALWSSWAMVGPTRRFFFSGDTGYFPGFRAIGRALGPFDAAAVPIGAYAPEAMMRPVHLDPEEALRVREDLGAEHALAMHFGTFDLTDEPLDEPPERFAAAAASRGLASGAIWIPRVGESWSK